MEKQNEKNESASLVLGDLISQSLESAEEHNQTFVVDEFDQMELSLRQAVLEEMRKAGLARCTPTLAMMGAINDRGVMGVVARTVMALCKCHKPRTSYRLHKLVAQATPLCPCNSKTGQKEVGKSIAGAINKLMQGTVDRYSKEGDFIVAPNPVQFSIEKTRKIDEWFIHFTD